MVFFIVPISMPRHFQRMVRHIFVPTLLITTQHRDTMYAQGLVRVSVFFRRVRDLPNGARNRFLPQRILTVSNARRVKAPFRCRVRVFPLFRRFYRYLEYVHLRVSVPMFPTSARAFCRVIGLARCRVLQYVHFVRATEPFRVVVVRRLNDVAFRHLICFCFVGHLRELLFLLRVVMVGNEDGKGLEANVVGPFRLSKVDCDEAIVTSAFRAPWHAIAVVVRLLIRNNALAGFRRASVYCRAFRFVI